MNKSINITDRLSEFVRNLRLSKPHFELWHLCNILWYLSNCRYLEIDKIAVAIISKTTTWSKNLMNWKSILWYATVEKSRQGFKPMNLSSVDSYFKWSACHHMQLKVHQHHLSNTLRKSFNRSRTSLSSCQFRNLFWRQNKSWQSYSCGIFKILLLHPTFQLNRPVFFVFSYAYLGLCNIERYLLL